VQPLFFSPIRAASRSPFFFWRTLLNLIQIKVGDSPPAMILPRGLFSSPLPPLRLKGRLCTHFLMASTLSLLPSCEGALSWRDGCRQCQSPFLPLSLPISGRKQMSSPHRVLPFFPENRISALPFQKPGLSFLSFFSR